MNKKTTLLFVTIIFFGCSSQNESTSLKKVITKENLKQFGIEIHTEGLFSELKSFDGISEQNYIFDDTISGVYLSNNVLECRNNIQAIEKYNSFLTQMTPTVELDFISLDSLYKTGDQSHWVIIQNKAIDAPVGNMFVYQKGKEVFFFTIIGSYFNSKDHWEKLIQKP
ncbi:hypothetical protein OAH12_01565 [Cyclobacteriaceae bacterium]|nr:hypothetical protein [Cyclobacteriaceae bacterium]